MKKDYDPYVPSRQLPKTDSFLGLGQPYLGLSVCLPFFPNFDINKLTRNARFPIVGRWDRLAVLEGFSRPCLRSWYSWKGDGVGEPCQGEHVDLAADVSK